MYQCTVFDDDYAFVYASICMHNPGVVDTYDGDLHTSKHGRHSSLNSILYIFIHLKLPKYIYIHILYIYVYTVYSLCLSCQVYPCIHSTRQCSGAKIWSINNSQSDLESGESVPGWVKLSIFRPFLDMGGSHFFLFNPLIAVGLYYLKTTNLKPWLVVLWDEISWVFLTKCQSLGIPGSINQPV